VAIETCDRIRIADVALNRVEMGKRILRGFQLRLVSSSYNNAVAACEKARGKLETDSRCAARYQNSITGEFNSSSPLFYAALSRTSRNETSAFRTAGPPA
jgi:hypothetical protein